MRLLTDHLAFGLQFVAAAQLGIALLNLFVPRILHWKEDLTRLRNSYAASRNSPGCSTLLLWVANPEIF